MNRKMMKVLNLRNMIMIMEMIKFYKKSNRFISNCIVVQRMNKKRMRVKKDRYKNNLMRI